MGEKGRGLSEEEKDKDERNKSSKEVKSGFLFRLISYMLLFLRFTISKENKILVQTKMPIFGQVRKSFLKYVPLLYYYYYLMLLLY